MRSPVNGQCVGADGKSPARPSIGGRRGTRCSGDRGSRPCNTTTGPRTPDADGCRPQGHTLCTLRWAFFHVNERRQCLRLKNAGIGWHALRYSEGRGLRQRAHALRSSSGRDPKGDTAERRTLGGTIRDCRSGVHEFDPRQPLFREPCGCALRELILPNLRRVDIGENGATAGADYIGYEFESHHPDLPTRV